MPGCFYTLNAPCMQQRLVRLVMSYEICKNNDDYLALLFSYTKVIIANIPSKNSWASSCLQRFNTPFIGEIRTYACL